MTIDGVAKALVADLVAGFPGLNPRPDRDGVRLLLYVGINPVISHGHTVSLPDPVRSLRSMREHAEIWVIDPRRTETARFATHHLSSRFRSARCRVRCALRTGPGAAAASTLSVCCAGRSPPRER